MADAATEPAIDAISALVPATLRALHAIEFAGRHLSPTCLATGHRRPCRPQRRPRPGSRRVAGAGAAWPARSRTRSSRTCRRSRWRGTGRHTRRSRCVSAHYRGLSQPARLCPCLRSALSPGGASTAGQPFLSRAAGARRYRAGRSYCRGRPDTRRRGFHAYRRAIRNAGRLLALCPRILRSDPKLAARCGPAWRQRQWRRVSLELAARGAARAASS